MEAVDLVIVGGGVIGCAVALACVRKKSSLSVCLLESEPELALHQSSRNSGVVHVGYNQKPGSIKAQFVVEGNRRIREFCLAHQVPLVKDGIVVVGRSEAEVETLKELCRRGRENGAAVELVDRKRLSELEPNAQGIAALHAPDGASFDSRGFVIELSKEAQALGAQICLSECAQYLREQPFHIEIGTNKRTLRARVLVNAAGLYADRVAHKLSIGLGYQILPFRGEYYELIPNRRDLVRSHIYPPPDLSFPFLGVHFSRTFDGRVIVGPGAVLAPGRHAYQTLAFDLPDVTEMLKFAGLWKLLSSADFRTLARREWQKSLFKEAVVAEARQLLSQLQSADLVRSFAGIRAQLVCHSGQLVDDLIVEESARSIHVLNAVSPALTCSLPFADQIASLIETKLSPA